MHHAAYPGDHGLGESNVILRYLAQKWHMTDWCPANLEDRSRIDEMTEFTSLHVGRRLYELAWNLHFGPNVGERTARMAARPAWKKVASDLDRQLQAK